MSEDGVMTVACPHCNQPVRMRIGVDLAVPAPAPDPTRATVEWLQQTWNARKSRTQIKSLKLSPALRAMARARIKEIPAQSDWIDIIDAIAKNRHCNGENDRQWVADFAYLVRAKTPLRVLEAVRQRQATGAPVPQTAREVQRASREANVGHVASDGMFTPEDLQR